MRLISLAFTALSLVLMVQAAPVATEKLNAYVISSRLDALS